MDRKIVTASIIGGVSLALMPMVALAAGGRGGGGDDTWSPGYGMMGGSRVDDDSSGSGDTDRDRDGTCDGMRSLDGTGTTALALVDGDIGDADAEALAYMVQEEKLAHDLYVALDAEYGLRVFDRISDAETQHQESVAALLDAYGLDDPTDGLAAGEFADADLQQLYDTLLAQGLESQTEALNVGALVEETDIADLQDRVTDEESVNMVFDNLEAASENHLRAFVMNLDRRGVDYTAQVLSDEELAEILD